ncbi:MAG TPA: DHA2 family efflux MFS transporter permease subunit [Streptosporangiaceae bacterium]|jgi:EmrB/QacA subfamily drug resistance transporter|nr:DHA2 family efflux MFS transporter permease subunit [Streptosporangiaceae bacterium]
MTSSDSRRWWALVAIAASVVVVGLDLTVLSLALPTLSRSLHASTGDLQWFSDAYSLVIAAVVLPAGLLGDRLGRKKVLLASLVLFGASSALCALSTSAGELIAARALLGLGAAAIMPLSLSVIPVLFTPDERPKAIAIMASATFVSFPIGPLLGGWLLDNFWWGSVFLINVPIVGLALIAVTALMPESRSQQRPRLDLPGVLISALGLTALTYGFIKAGTSGWGDTASLVTIATGVVVLAAFVAWERRVRARRGQPLVDLSLFSSAGFTWGTLLTTLISFALFGILFAMPLYFQDVRGLDALGSGVRLLPMIGGMVVGMIGGSRLQNPRKGPDGQLIPPPVSVKAMVTVGYSVMAAGLALGTFTHVTSGTGFAAAWFAVAGLGLGLAMPAAMNAAISALTAERSASGTALITAMRQVGATIGVAVLGTIINDAYRGGLHLTGLPTAAAGAVRASIGQAVQVAHATGSATLLGSVRLAYVHGLDIMLWVCAGIAVTSALLALLFLPRRVTGTVQDSPLGAADTGSQQAELSR